jgi:ubiquinone/menaquinone biosynthesis C-methylase UbiE
MAGTAPVEHPRFARFWNRLSQRAERLLGPERARLVDGLSGRVLEVGAGNGLSFAHYPAQVTELVAVEPEPALRAEAERRAARAAVPVRVVDATAAPLPFEDASFDAGVVSLVLCSVPDQAAALAELRRVIRPGGELRFMEHVRARNRVAAAVQEAADRTVWPRLFGGCHTARDTEAAIRAAGFEIASLERGLFPPVPITPTAPAIIGVARRP